MKHSTSPPVSHSDIGGVPHRARGLKYTKAIHTNYNEPYQEQIKKHPRHRTLCTGGFCKPQVRIFC